ncbi:hypothetical protein L1887_03668 [Cichorium endivia]|nr:hypothetical protein L1887_03668 [Cichorium endivia]
MIMETLYEIEIMRNMVSTQMLIELLQHCVKYYEVNNDTNNAHMTSLKINNDKVQVKKQWVQSALEMQWHFGEMMAHIEQEKIERLPTLETRLMISRLQIIEGLVSELPASERTAMQATFSKLCEEAAVVMKNMMDV